LGGIWLPDEFEPHFRNRNGVLFHLDDEYWERFEKKKNGEE